MGICRSRDAKRAATLEKRLILNDERSARPSYCHILLVLATNQWGRGARLEKKDCFQGEDYFKVAADIQHMS